MPLRSGLGCSVGASVTGRWGLGQRKDLEGDECQQVSWVVLGKNRLNRQGDLKPGGGGSG